MELDEILGGGGGGGGGVLSCLSHKARGGTIYNMTFDVLRFKAPIKKNCGIDLVGNQAVLRWDG